MQKKLGCRFDLHRFLNICFHSVVILGLNEWIYCLTSSLIASDIKFNL